MTELGQRLLRRFNTVSWGGTYSQNADVAQAANITARTYMNIHVSIRIKQVVPCPLSISVFYSKLLAILVALSAKKLPLECAKKNTRPVTKCLYEGIWFCSSTPKSSNSHICQIKAAD